MINCPNKNLPEFQALIAVYGEGRATAAWRNNNEVIPTVEQAAVLLGVPNAPNGNPSKLYIDILDLPEVAGDKSKAIQLYQQTQSPSFKRWFGNSKVVDKNGEPLMVHHGTMSSKINEFDKSFRGMRNYMEGDKGFFFTSNPEIAKSYAIEEQDPYGIYEDIDLPDKIGIVIPVFLKIKNLITYNEKSFNVEDKIGKVDRGLKNSDGVKFLTGSDDEFIVEEPNQIKSVFNQGEFSTESNNIYYQLPSTEGKIVAEQTIRDIASRMSERIGMDVRFESDRTKKYKGKIDGNTAVINLAYATADTSIHEVAGHSIMRALKTKSDTATKKELDNMVTAGQIQKEC